MVTDSQNHQNGLSGQGGANYSSAAWRAGDSERQRLQSESSGTSGDTSGLGGVIGFAICVFGLFMYWVWNTITSWQTLEGIYKYVAAYYYYIIAFPIEVGIHVYQWIGSQSLTSYPNVNTILSIASVLLPVILAFYVISKLIKLAKIPNWVLLYVVIGPALFALVWSLGSLSLEWVLSKQ